jgi:hypothetical protein
MAVTYANREILFRGSVTLMYVEITFDSSYTTSGEAINASDFGFAMILGINPFSAEGFVVEPVRSTDAAWLLKGYAWSGSTNTAIEFASGLNRSGITVPCIVIGR